ncbi:Transcription repressor OFP15 [Hirschfeldia incana]|nr:Transcription repressor OFP15 [Hirschfeldia incana]
MKLPFLNKNQSSFSCSSNLASSSTNTTSWAWPSCHQNPKTISFRATITFTNPIHEQDDDDIDPPENKETIESVIKGLRSSERLIFESKGESNSILEEATTKRVQEEEEAEEEEEGFMLLSLESNDPYSDFKRSMEEMVEAHSLHHDWRSLEQLLVQFLKVNAKTSHRYIFAAFVDLLLNLAPNTNGPVNNNIAKDYVDGVSASRAATGEASTSYCTSIGLGESPLSPLSFYTSCSSSSSSSDETSSTSVRFLPLSSLLEMDEKTKDILV